MTTPQMIGFTSGSKHQEMKDGKSWDSNTSSLILDEKAVIRAVRMEAG